MTEKKVLTFDFGASGGRAILVKKCGDKIELNELLRFPSNPVRRGEFLCWDAEYFFSMIDKGVSLGLKEGIDSIGIDTWGVDFGMLDENDRLIMDPIHYRDERVAEARTLTDPYISREELYSISGIQSLDLNTVNRFAYLKKYFPNELNRCKTLLMMSDLFAWHLTGEKKSELTLASTSGYLSAKTHRPDERIFSKIGVNMDIIPPTVMPGEVYGYLKPEFCDKKILVIAVCSHDTASAVVAVPATTQTFAFLSSGTWSLMGTELSQPIVTKETEKLNFTNELGYDGTVRFLKNIIGLWQLQETKRVYNQKGVNISYPEMSEMAKNSEATAFVDPDDQLFMPQGDMLVRVDEFLKKTGQSAPSTDGERLRVIYDSLALKYRSVLSNLETVTGNKYKTLYVVGGGTQDKLLAQLTANALERKVVCGPIEATAIGNAIIQLVALGEIESVQAARLIIGKSVKLDVYEPEKDSDLPQKLKKYEEIIGG